MIVIMSEVKALHFDEPDIIKDLNEIAQIEERKPHDSARRLLRRAARSKLARLKRQRKAS